MNRWIGILLAAAVVAGCQTSVKQTKEQADLRWQQTRAHMLYGVALEHFKVGQLSRAAAKATEALALAPDHVDARLLLGKTYIEQGHYASAGAELAKVCRQAPQSAEAAYMLGVAQEKAGRLDEALASYHRAQALSPSKCDAVIAAAEVLVAMGRLQEAHVYVEGYLGLAHEEPGLAELAGRLAFMLEDYRLAAKCYQQALDLDARNVRYRESLGQAHFRAGQHAEALEALKPLRQQADSACPAWVHMMMGDCWMALNCPREARQAYQAAQELSPGNPTVWVNVAKASLASGDACRATIAGQEALRLDGGSLDAVLLTGYAMLREGRFELAAVLLAGAAASFPDSGMLQCLLGRAHDAAGDGVQAARCYAAAARLEPDNELARHLLAGARRPPLPAE